MTLIAVEGAAGCGKTVRLMELVSQTIEESPLLEGQRVLALTFMHGARRRLNEKLRGIEAVRGRVECVTVDSFAQRLLRRWRGLARALGMPPLQPDQYDEQCDWAGALLECPEVRAWVAISFPVVLVDESQDLKPERLRMVSALAESVSLLVAADEFQCLSQELRPNPCVTWLRAACKPVVLTEIRRTDVQALLTAAATIRGGGVAQNGQGFKVLAAKGMPMAGTYLANALAWRKGGNAAVITPSLKGGFAQKVVAQVGQGPCGKHQNGPYTIRWEQSDSDEVAKLIEMLELANDVTAVEAVTALQRLPRSGAVREVISWVRRQARTGATTSFGHQEVEKAIARQVQLRRQRYAADRATFSAMTVQQAKNREFDGVVVLWPYQVGGDDEHKRRLLYNAITRARRWCAVVLQSEDLLKGAPFA
ncbi:ATP-dependent helicase [Robbsia andropogonis]|uniref:ATP-dependent helicase n=1 Tax=Robbsia andropogonis TaxID=28092 RepID=UPI002A698C17|nr:ATP-dependent helicase [Robbsia andropogonis]